LIRSLLKTRGHYAMVYLTGNDEKGEIREHLIRQKEGFNLRGFTLRKSENWEKIST
jgi:hypothetical protein